MSKLSHLAILTRQPEKLVDFYKHVFEMKELYRIKNGSVHLTDGAVNLAILNADDPKERGKLSSPQSLQAPARKFRTEGLLFANACRSSAPRRRQKVSRR